MRPELGDEANCWYAVVYGVRPGRRTSPDSFRGRVLWYTTKPPEYHRKSLFFVKNRTICTLCKTHFNPFHINGYELKRLDYSGVFPSWTSRVRIPSPALENINHAGT